MRLHHAAPFGGRAAPPHAHLFSPPGAPRTAPPISVSRQRKQRIKDILAVAAVVALILATAAMIVSYAVHEAPRWRAGVVGNFEPTPIPPAQQQAAQAGAQAAASDPAAAVNALGRVPLILISTVVEMAIFVALGLYLRHDMNRKR